MVEFLLAILCFLLAHSIPPAPPVRRRLVSILGRSLYLFAYSVLSIALLVWIIVAAHQAPLIIIWYSRPWQAIVPIVAMPVAFWLGITGLAEANPLSITIRRPDPVRPLAPIVTITRHPVLWGFLIWALVHMAPNGDLVSLILFGGMALLAIAGMPILDRRARRRLGDRRWKEVARSTSIIPFAAILAGSNRLRFDAAFTLHSGIGLALYLWFLLQGHALLVGPAPLAWLGW